VKAAVYIGLRDGDDSEGLLEVGRLQQRAFHNSL
jgi:hypothetical protein